MDRKNIDVNKEDLNFDDEKELDLIFEKQRKTKLTKVIRKAKVHSLFRNIIVTLLVITAVFVVGSFLNNRIIEAVEGYFSCAVDSFNEISAPNKYIGESTRYHYFLKGKTEYNTYKIIEGKVVYSGEGEYYYGLFQNYYGNTAAIDSSLIIGTSYDTEDLKLQRYNTLGQREMLFFYPFIEYTQYKEDLQLVNNMDANKIMEMALSFDKSYNIKEVNSMLPSDVTLSWYWVDDLNEAEKKSENKKVEESIVTYNAKIRSENTAYGIKAYDNNGEIVNEPQELFILTLQNERKENSRFRSEYERIYNTISGKDGKLTEDDIKILGVVVTGDSKELGTLSQLPYIKASSLGVVTDRY